MVNKKEISEFELFYDLIFAYAFSQVGAIMLVTTNQIISFQTIGQFLLTSLAFGTIWSYQTVFANRFSVKNKMSPLFLFFDMFWVLVLSQSVNQDMAQTHVTFASATSILFFSLAVQYYLKMRITDDAALKNLCFQLVIMLSVTGGIGFITVFPWGSFAVRISIYGFSVLMAAIFPLTLKKMLAEVSINFGDLTERYSLFTLFLFVAAVIAVARTILFDQIGLGNILFFLVVLALFLFYHTIYKTGINRQNKTGGLVLIYSHYFIFIGISLIVALYEKYLSSTIQPLFFVLSAALSLAFFLGGIIINMIIYSKKAHNYLPFISKNLLFFIAWIALSLLIQDIVWLFLIVTILFLLFFLYKVKRELSE
ncbi:low temperature requirement protein A [Erwinia sp. CPCC 100877]|nr:low temperature requirement protein A [Erwinia sp. CPCC 100877]